MMNYRLIKPLASSSSFGKEAIFHGCLIGRCKQQQLQYSTNLYVPPKEEPDYFHFLHPWLWPFLDLGTWKKKPSYKLLGSGIILLKRYINLKCQLRIVNTIVRMGPERFYMPRNEYGDRLRFYMMTFGRYWDPVTKYGKPYRSDHASEPPEIPHNFKDIAKTAIKDANAFLDEELPSIVPDICVANFYIGDSGRHGIHQDCDESYDSLEKGLPVVSICVGENAEFWYGHTRDVSKMSKEILKSGDVLIYGGESRLIYHGLKEIGFGTLPDEVQAGTGMIRGHLNITLKQV